VRNVQLCVFTLPIAAATVGWQWSAVRAQGLVLDPPTVLLVVLNATGGLLVAAVIKYGDNILKNFTTACSVIIGTLISVVLFDFQLTVSFAWGSLLVASSAYVFATSPEPVAPSVMRTEAESGTPLMAARENTDEETRSDESADGWRETGAQTLVRGGAAR
jgi:UDP-sugar transporter A1/2/3